jgi:dihydropyrimidinase/dihydroorotase
MANQLFRTDFFLTPILIEEEQVTEIPQLAKQFGITSYKVYLHGKFAYKFLDFWPPLRTSYGFKTGFDDGMVYQIFEFVSRIGPPGIVCMHCENWEIARVFRERLIKAGRKDMAAWSEGSPHFCEAGHVRTYAYYAKWANCPVYIMHTTTEETVKEIELARTEGVKIFGQTGTNYLTLDYTGHKHVVPIRDRETQEKLWQALNNGIVDTVGTDHVSLGFPREEVMKKRDVWSAIESYTAHAQMHLPILLSEGVNKNRLSLTRMVQVACENPAKIFGLYPKKGAIQVGSDADLVVVDLHLTRKVTDDMILSSSGWSNYEGWEMKGWPVMTILRGDVVMEWPEEESKPRIIGAPKGKYLPRVPGCQFYPMS